MKSPKYLLINDIHVADNNIIEFNKNWDEAIDVCKEHGINHIVVGGDLFQSRVSQTLAVLLTVQGAMDRAASADLLVTLANGNHCKVDQESIFGYCHVFKDHHCVKVINDVTYLKLDSEGENCLVVLPYFPEDGSFTSRLKEIYKHCEGCPGVLVLYAHAGIKGSLKVDAATDLPTNLFDAFDKVLVGHYHDRTKIKGTNIEYIGASRQHNFGEDEEKGYTILFDDGSTQFVKNKANTRYKTLSTTYKDYPAFAEKLRLERSNYEGYKLKLRVECTESESAQLTHELVEAGVINKLEIVRKDIQEIETKSSKVFEKFDMTGLKDTYAEFCEIKKVEDVSTGMNYLNKIQ